MWVGFNKTWVEVASGWVVRVLTWGGVGLLLTIWRLLAEGYGLQGDLALHYHLARTAVAGMAWGEWWPVWAGLMEGGRGSSLFTFYPPLLYVLTGLLSLAGVSLIGALGVMTVLTLVSTQWAAWRMAGICLQGRPRMLASVMGVALPGVALIGVNRGFLTQSLATCFLVLTIDGLIRILGGERRSGDWWLLCGGLVGVVLSHPVSAYLAALTTILVIAVRGGWCDRQVWQAAGRIGLACLFCAAVTAFFWIPQISELNWVKIGLHLEKQSFHNYLLFAKASTATPYRQAWQGLNEVAGLVTLVQSGLSLVAVLVVWRKSSAIGKGGDLLVRYGVAGTVFGLLISLPALELLWDVIPGLPFIQFPWRLQPLVGIVGGVLTVTAMSRRAEQVSRLVVIGESVIMLLLGLGIILTCLLCRAQSKPGVNSDTQFLTAISEKAEGLSYDEARALQEGGSREFVRYTANLVYFRPQAAETKIYPAVDQPGGLELIGARVERIETLKMGMSERRFRVRLDTPAKGRLLSYAYPHWQARVDGKTVPISVETGTGLMLVDLPAGEYELHFRYGQPLYPRLISLIALVGTLIVMGFVSIRRWAWYTPGR